MKPTFSIIVGVLVSTALSLVHGAPPRNHTTSLRKRNVELQNWAGVAIAAPPGGSPFVTVIGTFVVPKADKSTSPPGTAVSLWVGIDGYMPLTPPLIQAGVHAQLDADSEEVYMVWTEWVDGTANDGPEFPDIDVTAGDTVQVQVTGQPGTSTATVIFTINGVKQNDVLLTPNDGAPQNTILGNNIEWVIERVPGEGNVEQDASLLNFGTINFSACSGSTEMTAASSFPTNGDLIDMGIINADGLAATSALNGDDGITITWLHA